MAGKISRLFSYGSIAVSGGIIRLRGAARKESLLIVNFTFQKSPLGIRHPGGGLQCQFQVQRMASTQSDADAVQAQIKLETKDEESKVTSDLEVKTEPANNAELTTSQDLSSASTSADGPTPTSEVKTEPEEKKPFIRIPKIKAAILLSYSGQGYFGLQLQKDGTKTIENDLLKALFDAGVIDEDGFEKPKSIKFQRAARTDKNVSAARNIISVMVPKTFDVDTVNKHLLDQVRLMDFRRVTKGFDSKICCSARTYLYMIPTFAFTPLEQKVQEDYRISPEVLESLRETLKLYLGCKNYHNFTCRKKATDPSAKRYIISFTASDPFLKDGLEYVVLQVKGQSFMLHQIRKMIGLAVAIQRGYATVEIMQKCFQLDRIDIPMAPGLGLMLGEAHYDQYNKKFGTDGIHEPLMWDNVADKIEKFCQDQIYTVVTRTVNEEKSTFQWLATIPIILTTIEIRIEEGRRLRAKGRVMGRLAKPI